VRATNFERTGSFVPCAAKRARGFAVRLQKPSHFPFEYVSSCNAYEGPPHEQVS
jgi:hypothetical protein